MLHLIPPPLHRLALRVAYRVRSRFRRVFKPDLAGVSVILFDGEGRIMLARHTYGPEGWALLSGGLKRGEDPEEGLRREIREELACELTSLEVLQRIDERVSGAPHTAHVYSARLAGEAEPDGREIAQLRWFARHELGEVRLTRLTRTRLVSLGLYSSDS